MEEKPTLRDEFIKQIEGLYPPDSEEGYKAPIGRSLLGLALEEFNLPRTSEDWRTLPEEVLHRLATLNREEEEREYAAWEQTQMRHPKA